MCRYLVTEDAELHLAGDVGEAVGARETLVLLRVVVLESNLELHGLKELALLVLAALKHSLNTFPQVVAGELYGFAG